MIFNRTQADVDIAITLRKKLQAGQSLNDSEKAIIERGTCTISMLNRVENKQVELSRILNEMAYTITIENKTDWAYTDIFTYQDHQRLLNNLDKLKEAYFSYTSTPKAPTYMFGYRQANDIEKILVDIENMINDMTSRFRECGTFECGEENKL